ncbi:MAG: response regulator [Myxococcota bacterium]|nr:response regulator [Myxococcota bacterium]
MAAIVMVVDDSQMVRQQVGKALVGAGFSVIEAHDGADALGKLSNVSGATGPSLIVLDVNMPNMGGFEFLQNLRARPELAALPVVMLTTEGDPKLMQQAKALGAKGWIVKPFRPELLIAAARKLTQ